MSDAKTEDAKAADAEAENAQRTPEPSSSGTSTAAPSGDPTELVFFTEVGIIEQLVRNRVERMMTDGLSLAQFSLLNHFVRLGGSWNPVRLASAFQVSKAAMTKIVAKLRDKGFVTVTPDPTDGRGKLVAITLAGHTVRNRAIAQLAPFVAEFREQFDPATLEGSLPLLQAVRTWLDENR